MVATIEEEAEAAHWGIDPVPEGHRRLTGFQLGLLWGDLGIGLLVIISGAVLVAPAPGFGLGLGPALAAIVLGSAIGSALLAYAGGIGTSEGRPTMAILRDLLGVKGSWVPTTLNVAQLLGWTAFELWAMAHVAGRLSLDLWGTSFFFGWLVFFTLLVLGLSLWGPLGVVRTWMQRFGAWFVLGVGSLATIGVVAAALDGASLRWAGGGSSWLGVPMDVVIALPVSWIPLVADYNRFGTSVKGAVWGTGIGYMIANVWFYGLGATLLAVMPETGLGPEGIAASLLVIGGGTLTGVALLGGLVVGETDEGFADVYSAAVSLKNLFPSVSSKKMVVMVAVAGAGLAGVFTMQAYEFFLLLLGSVFVPLVGVWLTDRAFLRGTADVRQRRATFAAWIVGFLVYHWIAPTPLNWWTTLIGHVTQPLWPRIPWLGASLPSLLTAGFLHVVIQRSLGRASRGSSRVEM